MSDVVVRRARADELARAGEVTEAGYAADGYLVRPGGGYDEHYASQLRDAAARDADSPVLVAVEGDDVVGAVTWCPPGSSLREVTDADDQGELRMLAVAPDARGRGIGAALLDACLDAARAAGLRQVRLCSLPEMRPAHRMYATRGFARRPDLDWSPFPDVLLWGFALDLTRTSPHHPEEQT